MNVMSNLISICLKALPVGTIREWSDGKYKKTQNGKWERVSEGKEKKESNEIEDNKYVEKQKDIKIHGTNFTQNDISELKNLDENAIKNFSKKIINNYKQNINDLKILSEKRQKLDDEIEKEYKKLGDNANKEEIEKYNKKYDLYEKEKTELNKNIENNELYKIFDSRVSNPEFYNNLEENINKYFIKRLNKKQYGDHWGSANAESDYAKNIAIINNNGEYHPIDKLDDKNYQPEYTIDNIIDGIRLRNLAQEKIKKFPKEKYPEVYRGMMLSKEDMENLLNNKNKEIQLTGCTAFTFYEKIANIYKTSEWTKGLSGNNNIPVILKCKRDDKFDNKIGMWHEVNKEETLAGIEARGDSPAYEILSGLNKLKINNILKKDNYFIIESEGINENE